MAYYPLVNAGRDLAARVSPGAGEGILWLHPYALDSSCWSEVWDRLPAFRHLGIDLPGHGLSLPAPAREDLPALARRIGAIAIERDVRHVVGLGLGALVGLQIAIELNEAVHSLVLGSPVVAAAAPNDDFPGRLRELASMYRMAGYGEHLRGRLMTVGPNVFEGSAGRPELWTHLWRAVGCHPFWDVLDGSTLRWSTYVPADAALDTVRARTLIVTGRAAPPPAAASAPWLARRLRGCDTVVLEETTGLPLLEAPEAGASAVGQHIRAST
jgi:pimeloyl-ACP methyl ester carboxylesterase